MGQVALLPALVQIIESAYEVSRSASVLEQVFGETSRAGREHLAGHEVGPEVAVPGDDSTGADDPEFVDELSLDGVDFALELGEGHRVRLIFVHMDVQD